MDRNRALNTTSNNNLRDNGDGKSAINIVPLISKDVVSAVGFNVNTPIVSAIIGNLQGTLPTRKIDTEPIKCNICDCELSSNTMLNFHLNGIKHKKKLKALEIIENLKRHKDATLHLGDKENPNNFRCDLCLMTVNSAQQLEFHLSGVKHKKKAAAASAAVSVLKKKHPIKKQSDSMESLDLLNKRNRKDGSFLIPCQICHIFLNSKMQFNQHLVSRKHLSKLKEDKHPRESDPNKVFINLPYLKSQFNVNHNKITSRFCRYSL